MSTTEPSSRTVRWTPLMLRRAVAAGGAASLVIAMALPAYGGYRIAVIAGGSVSGDSGDGGPALEALLDHPEALTHAADGTLYVADTGNNRVRAIDTNGIISTVAGNGVQGSRGDGGLAVAAELDQPRDIAVDGNGNLYVVDGSPARVRRVDAASGRISTFLGPGLADYATANDTDGNVFFTLTPIRRAYGFAYLLALTQWDDPFLFTPIPIVNLYPYDLAAADPQHVLVAVGTHEHGVGWQDGRLLWKYDPEEYSVNGPLGIALSKTGRLYVTASTFYSGGARFVMRSRGLRLHSVAGGGTGDVVDGADADLVALDPTAIASSREGVIHVVSRPSRIVALERGPKDVGRILGSATGFPGRLSSFSPGRTTSIFAEGDNGVLRFTQPNRRGQFHFADLPPGRYTVYARYREEGFSCDALNCGWSGAPDDCPQRPLNDAVVDVTAAEPRRRVQLYLLDSFPCI